MLTVLAGCVSGGAAAPTGLAINTALVYDGAEYLVNDGADLVLSRAAPAMRYDEGLTAKHVAEARCAERGRWLNSLALGRFQAGSWIFDGGCA
jgi:hypothetical protein